MGKTLSLDFVGNALNLRLDGVINDTGSIGTSTFDVTITILLSIICLFTVIGVLRCLQYSCSRINDPVWCRGCRTCFYDMLCGIPCLVKIVHATMESC